MLDVEAEAQVEPKVHKITVDEYQKLGELEWFWEHRVELIDGEIVEMAPKKDLHTTSTSLANDVVRQVFGPGWVVRIQDPIHVSNYSEPEPDIAVVPGGPRDFVGKGHPKSAALVIEVSESTLRYDRRKGGLYAAAGIPDYWIINLVNRQIEVFRTPVVDTTQQFGHRYADTTIIKIPDKVSPLAVPSAQIAVADLLP